MGCYQFKTTCVELSIEEGCKLKEAMQDGRRVSYKTIARRLAPGQIARFKVWHGYDMGGVKMVNDPCISYHRIKWQGAIAYVIQWSAIEHIYTR